MKHLLVVDVELTNENKHICKDDNNRCPLWNEEVNLCMYNFNNKTKGCPLKPMPQKKELEESGNSLIDDCKEYYIDGWNDCLNKILGDEK